MDRAEYDGPRHRRVGLVGRIGCLPLLAAVLVTAVLLVIAYRMLDSPKVWRANPVEGLAWPDTIPIPTGLAPTASAEPSGSPSPSPSPTATPASPSPSPSPSRTATPSPAVSPQPRVTRLEAEDAQLWRAEIDATHRGFTGRGYANYDNDSGCYVQWTFESPRAGRVTLRLRYANGSYANRPMDVVVNGRVVSARLGFAPTGEWTTWQVRTLDVDVRQGANQIRFTAARYDGGPNVDYLEIVH